MLFDTRFFCFLTILIFLSFPGHSQEDNIDCKSLMTAISSSSEINPYNQERNLFSDSLPSTIASAMIWLTSVQALKAMSSQIPDSAILTDTFLRTVPIDIVLTSLSHAISLGYSAKLKAIMDGSLFSEKFEFASRTLANTVLSTLVISTIWQVSGIDLSIVKIGGAFLLSASVYPVLQLEKNLFFKKLPRLRDNAFYDRFVSKLSSKFLDAISKIRSSVDASKLDEAELKQLTIIALESSY